MFVITIQDRHNLYFPVSWNEIIGNIFKHVTNICSKQTVFQITVS